MPGQLSVALNRMPYHIGLATNDVERARDTLGEVFGLTWTAIRTVEGEMHTVGAYAGPTRRSHSRGGPMRFELLEGTPESVWATDRLAELHHYAYWSADVAADVRALISVGWAVEMATVDESGEPTLFSYVTKPGHTRVELLSDDLRAGYAETVGDDVPPDVAH